MKKILLTTVAVAAVVGFTGIAAAQNSEGQSKAPAGAQQEQKAAPGGGAMMHPQGAQPAPKTLNPGGQSAQGPAQGVKQGDRMGQTQDQKETKTPQSTQGEQRGTEQKGAQDEHATPLKGAQDERGTNQRGAQEESPKSGVNAAEQHTTESKARGASAQLSQNQRSRIGAIIGKSSARVTTNVQFNVAVGVRVPHDVHVEVLPEDVVEIVPEYEGYDYVIVGDNILIIDPDSLEIVAVIPV
jgi:hypothetical protein